MAVQAIVSEALLEGKKMVTTMLDRPCYPVRGQGQVGWLGELCTLLESVAKPKVISR
jgi:hypothetical protein